METIVQKAGRTAKGASKKAKVAITNTASNIAEPRKAIHRAHGNVSHLVEDFCVNLKKMTKK